MIKNVLLILTTILLTSCNQSREQTAETSGDWLYEVYCNDRFDYCIDYPNFLIPQGEADNGDGQQFVSADGKILMRVYHAFEIDLTTGDFLNLEQAYKQDLKKYQPEQHEKDDMYYKISGEHTGRRYVHYRTMSKDSGFINIQFEYPPNENLDEMINYVVESLHIGYNEFEVEEEFVAFLNVFLNKVWWDKEFNAILLDKTTEELFYPHIDIKRLYAPGTIALLAGVAENYGFTDYDSGSVINISEKPVFLSLPEDLFLCELEDESTVYYTINADLPEYVINSETFEMGRVENPLGDAPVAAVYLIRKGRTPRIFYFLATVDGWKLALIDDSQCEA